MLTLIRRVYALIRPRFKWTAQDWKLHTNKPQTALYPRLKWTVQEVINVAIDWYDDYKLGIDTYGLYNVPENKSRYGDEIRYEPLGYPKIKRIFKNVRLAKSDIIADIGCGKGRVMYYLAQLPEIVGAQIIGIELRTSIYNMALQNLKTFKKRDESNVTIYNADATTFNMQGIIVYFMFYPFGMETLAYVLDKIKETLITEPRNIKIIYYFGSNVQFKEYMDSLTWLVPIITDEDYVVYGNKR